MLVKEAEPVERLITVDEFERTLAKPEYANRLIELINGEIIEKTPTEEHGIVALNLATPLNLFVKSRRIGRVGVEVRQRLPHDRLNSRMPDISFSTARRPIVRQGACLKCPIWR